MSLHIFIIISFYFIRNFSVFLRYSSNLGYSRLNSQHYFQHLLNLLAFFVFKNLYHIHTCSCSDGVGTLALNHSKVWNGAAEAELGIVPIEAKHHNDVQPPAYQLLIVKVKQL